ncbi:uncharacterized protein LOC113503130 [Trichoplusia ni]|uniref:Uncharacterized protein LOC113503130 n=1 Tax=Trichoplusia ni TaxID=7111 RepID=A0A7E5WJ78_TRINI|nr:uncharacterized protein LOC113503130 [Trichoplusia ni]
MTKENIMRIEAERKAHEKPDEENQPNYEYIHIFKSIPALFEYLLNALEERPEILEKNDVTIFKRNVDIVDEENESTDEHKTDKREVGCDNKEGRFEENNKIDKRDAETTNVKENVKSYEFGNSNIVMKDYDDAPNVKRFAAKIHPKDIRASRDKVKIEKAKFNKFQNYRGKRSVLMKLSDDDEDVFLQKENTFYGFQNFFDLDLNPEDIEERILTAEKLLEEHNSKKDKDK